MKAFAISIIFSVFVFLISGYWMSDDRYFRNLIEAHHIENADDAFRFVNANIEFPGAQETVNIPMTPRYMLEQKNLWCDQGAIVLATIVNELGYETRLLNMQEIDGIFGHTVLQIRENGKWINYDTVLKKKGLTPEEIRQSFQHDASAQFYFYSRPYPNWYNFLVQNNFYFKKAALFLRGGAG